MPAKDKHAAQRRLIRSMTEKMAQIEQIAADRAAFSKRFRDYAETCSDEEYNAFRSSFLPQLKISETTTITPDFIQYKTKDAFIKFFNNALSNYTKIIIQCKKALKNLSMLQTDDDLDQLKKDTDKLFQFLDEWQLENEFFFKTFKAGLRKFLTSRGESYTNVTESLVKEFKNYALPELDFVAEMSANISKIVTKAAAPTAATLSELSADENKDKSLAIVKKVQEKLKLAITKVKAELADLRKDDPEEKFLTQQRFNTIISDLEPTEPFLSSELPKRVSRNIHEARDWYDFVYELNWVMHFCDVIHSELKDIRDSLPKKSARQSVSSASSGTKKPVHETLQELSLEPDKSNEEEDDDAQFNELRKQAEIDALNAQASQARKDQRTAKQEAYQARALHTDQQEEEDTGSSLKPKLVVLNNANYETLIDVFAEKHNTITYSQAENLITCEAIGGKITSGSGSNRKITIKGIDSHTFEPSDSTISGGFHAKHRSGHNDKTLIRPIVQDIKTVLEKAGFTPDTCVAKRNLTPNPPS